MAVLTLRLRVMAGQIRTREELVSFQPRRDGRVTAHLRFRGEDFEPPIDLGSEIIVDVEEREG